MLYEKLGTSIKSFWLLVLLSPEWTASISAKKGWTIKCYSHGMERKDSLNYKILVVIKKNFLLQFVKNCKISSTRCATGNYTNAVAPHLGQSLCFSKCTAIMPWSFIKIQSGVLKTLCVTDEQMMTCWTSDRQTDRQMVRGGYVGLMHLPSPEFIMSDNYDSRSRTTDPNEWR